MKLKHPRAGHSVNHCGEYSNDTGCSKLSRGGHRIDVLTKIHRSEIIL